MEKIYGVSCLNMMQRAQYSLVPGSNLFHRYDSVFSFKEMGREKNKVILLNRKAIAFDLSGLRDANIKHVLYIRSVLFRVHFNLIFLF